MMKLKGKVVLITGGSTGIGKAIAKAFLEEGAKIIVFGLNKPDYNAEFYKVDISKEEDIKKSLQKITSIDIIVNNAGIARILNISETTTEILNSILDINFKGAFWTCRHALPKLKGGGCIINISSIAGIKSFPDYGAYCASKAALVSLTKTLALELAPRKIRANAIAPGVIDTPIFSKMFESKDKASAQLKKWIEEIPLKRAGTPEEIAHAAVFLSQNEFVNGIVLSIDGGECAI